MQKCKTQVSAKVLLRLVGDDGAVDHVACSAYGKVVNQLANLPSDHKVTVKELLMAKPISQIDYITNKKDNCCGCAPSVAETFLFACCFARVKLFFFF